MTRLSEALYGAYATIAAVVSALVVGTLGVLPFAMLPRGRREHYTLGAAAFWANLFVEQVLLTTVRRTGDANLPDGQGALVICNHRSWLDPPLLIGKTRANGLSKMLVFWIPFVGLFGHLAGAVFFNRNSHAGRAQARRDVMYLLRTGNRVHVYPEGTRTLTGELREKVYLTLVKDCFDEGIPVIPCALYGTERVLPPGRFAAIPGQEVHLDIGPALWPRDYANADAYAEAAWGEVRARFERLRRPAIPAATPERSDARAVRAAMYGAAGPEAACAAAERWLRHADPMIRLEVALLLTDPDGLELCDATGVGASAAEAARHLAGELRAMNHNVDALLGLAQAINERRRDVVPLAVTVMGRGRALPWVEETLARAFEVAEAGAFPGTELLLVRGLAFSDVTRSRALDHLSRCGTECAIGAVLAVKGTATDPELLKAANLASNAIISRTGGTVALADVEGGGLAVAPQSGRVSPADE